jgi:hypothetical protein
MSPSSSNNDEMRLGILLSVSEAAVSMRTLVERVDVGFEAALCNCEVLDVGPLNT